MNLILHHLKKDVRQLRLLLITWLILIVLSVIGTGVVAEMDNWTLQMTLMTSLSFLLGLQMVIPVVIIAQLVQSDSPVGTTLPFGSRVRLHAPAYWQPKRYLSPWSSFSCRCWPKLLFSLTIRSR